MKKIDSFFAISLIVLLGVTLIYNSGRDYYNLQKLFYDSYFRGQIVKILDQRDYKIYYNNEDFFSSGFCDKQDAIHEKVKVGDYVSKRGTVVEFYRDSIPSVMLRCNVIKPADSYASYFFN